MPRHSPDHLVVGLVYLMQHRAETGIPINNLALFLSVSRTREQILFERMPRNHVHRVIMSLKTIQLFVKLAQVKHFDL